MLSSCKNDIKEVNALSAGDSIPDLTAKNFVYLRSVSGRIVAKLQSPRMTQFGGEDPYMEFPDGFKIEFYNKLMQVESVLTAEYGIQYDKRKLIIARKNVVIVNLIKNEQLNAEELFWDQRRKKIYSESKIKFTTPTQILFGAGFESDENFRDYEIFKGSGDFEIDEEIK
jgi:LPS export ABC transporter protein LptC